MRNIKSDANVDESILLRRFLTLIVGMSHTYKHYWDGIMLICYIDLSLISSDGAPNSSTFYYYFSKQTDRGGHTGCFSTLWTFFCSNTLLSMHSFLIQRTLNFNSPFIASLFPFVADIWKGSRRSSMFDTRLLYRFVRFGDLLDIQQIHLVYLIRDSYYY